jgi:hypothetical protein
MVAGQCDRLQVMIVADGNAQEHGVARLVFIVIGANGGDSDIRVIYASGQNGGSGGMIRTRAAGQAIVPGGNDGSIAWRSGRMTSRRRADRGSAAAGFLLRGRLRTGPFRQKCRSTPTCRPNKRPPVSFPGAPAHICATPVSNAPVILAGQGIHVIRRDGDHCKQR